jgi:hypothetical protein
MKNTIKILKKIEYPLIEADMANIDPKEHQFGVNVKLNILQPGERKYKHGPRVKVFNKDPDINFSVALNKSSDELKIIGDPAKVISWKDLVTLLSKIKKYKMAFLIFWYNRSMSVREWKKLILRIDKGESLKEELNNLRKE